jgi:chromosome segregation ATPase
MSSESFALQKQVESLQTKNAQLEASVAHWKREIERLAKALQEREEASNAVIRRNLQLEKELLALQSNQQPLKFRSPDKDEQLAQAESTIKAMGVAIKRFQELADNRKVEVEKLKDMVINLVEENQNA